MIDLFALALAHGLLLLMALRLLARDDLDSDAAGDAARDGSGNGSGPP